MAKKKKVFIFRKAADVAMAVSAAYAPFAAAVSYHAAAAAPAALAFALGHGALLFMLPFSVYALAFLRAPRGLHQTPYPMLACAVAAPAALLAAVLAVPVLAADDVALAWAANASAAAALWWCLTNGGYTAVAFSRVDQYASFMDAVERTPEIAFPLVFDVPATAKAARRDAVRFAAALSATCAVAGGAAVGVLGGLSSAAAAIAAALCIFALPMCLLYVPENHMDPYPTIDGVLQRNPAAAWCTLLAPVALVLCGLVRASAATNAGDVGTFATVIAGAFWAMDAGAAVLLGRVIAGEITMARETGKHSIYRSSSSEIMSALLMVWVRYFVYLHVFHLIGCGGHLTWFNSSH
ncbi:Os12g0548000 [Oryza sativa Japonica Group]|uniref:Os12g0548000 protein n=2 Tax=Oryza TaxID=4527 RepID=Q2QP01_ORYSJ|nr:hypothetical protein LOC_Os12g36160 [Oryza sativa Japonica Group]BAT17542.1 Os12g0548000 [Oryza sativa Japonica Group]